MFFAACWNQYSVTTTLVGVLTMSIVNVGLRIEIKELEPIIALIY
jgi:hypothetical protein